MDFAKISLDTTACEVPRENINILFQKKFAFFIPNESHLELTLLWLKFKDSTYIFDLCQQEWKNEFPLFHIVFPSFHDVRLKHSPEERKHWSSVLQSYREHL